MGEQPENTASNRVVIIGVVWSVVWPGSVGVLLSLVSGQWPWPVAWAYLGTYSLVLLLGSLFAVHRDTGFAEERTRAKEGVKAWDRVLAGPALSVFWLGVYVVAGLDARHGWPPALPPAVQIAGVALAGAGYLLAVLAMAANKFYGRYVRIQTDRGHRAVDTGPYRYLRHPGYAGLIAFFLASAFALASLWALIPAGVCAIVLVIRTALEDRTLIAELEGYAEYARRTRYRLIPGLW